MRIRNKKAVKPYASLTFHFELEQLNSEKKVQT